MCNGTVQNCMNIESELTICTAVSNLTLIANIVEKKEKKTYSNSEGKKRFN